MHLSLLLHVVKQVRTQVGRVSAVLPWPTTYNTKGTLLDRATTAAL